MKIAINALAARRGGGQTYILNFLKFFSADSKDQLLLICGRYNEKMFRNAAGHNPHIQFYISPFYENCVILRSIWEMFFLPAFLRNNDCSVYFAPSGIMCNFFGMTGIRKVTALRNMLPFDERERKRFPLLSFIRWKLLILRFVYLISYRLCDGVIFISNYSRDCIRRYIPSIDEKSVVIYHGLNSLFLYKQKDISILSEYGLLPGKYVLYVSILDYYKAQKEVISDWMALPEKEFPEPLILVGACINQYGREVVEQVEATHGRVRFLGKIDYEKLPALYQNAKALIFASSCECCPNILLEKMAAGVPVFSSNIPPMPEFGGPDVFYFDPYVQGSLKNILITGQEFPSELRHRGELLRKRSETLFNWNDTVKKTVSFLIHNKD